MMEELTKRNGKGVWLREIEKALKRFDASIEWLLERIQLGEDEIETIKRSEDIEECEKEHMIRAKKSKEYP